MTCPEMCVTGNVMAIDWCISYTVVWIALLTTKKLDQ